MNKETKLNHRGAEAQSRKRIRPLKFSRAMQKAIAEELKRCSLEEVLQLFGDFPECDQSQAIEIDWLHVLLHRVTDLMELSRTSTHPDLAAGARQYRANLAAIVICCAAWERRICQ